MNSRDGFSHFLDEAGGYGEIAIPFSSRGSRLHWAFGAGIVFFSSSRSWKGSHSWSRLLSAVCFSSLERDLGTLSTEPQRNGPF